MIFKKYPLLLLFCLSLSVAYAQDTPTALAAKNLDAWHQAASNADFDTYFSLMTSQGVFVGTDASEHWENKAFRDFSRPYFKAGKAWSFTSLERHMYTRAGVIWFDELLDTQMGICRGSGVMELEAGQWKVAHYVLSIAVPNNKVSALLELKKAQDSLFVKKLLGLDL